MKNKKLRRPEPHAFVRAGGNGFTAVLIGSAGPIAPDVRALAEKLGPVDVAIVAYQVHVVAETQIHYTWLFIELFEPKLFLPGHHGALPPTWVDLGLEPQGGVVQVLETDKFSCSTKARR